MQNSDLKSQIKTIARTFVFEVIEIIKTQDLKALGELDDTNQHKRPLQTPVVLHKPLRSWAEEKQDIVSDIVAFLGICPEVSGQRIAQHVGKPLKTVWLVLSELRRSGKVVADGKSVNMTYRLSEK